MASQTIEKAVTGQALIEAVKAVAGKEYYHDTDWQDGKDVVIVGQSSSYPYRDIAVEADGKTAIDPTATYTKITVKETEWGGIKYAVGYGRDDVVKAVKEFAQKLQQQLA